MHDCPLLRPGLADGAVQIDEHAQPVLGPCVRVGVQATPEPGADGGADGQVVDRYGLRWLIGFEDDQSL